ncbi:MAG: hypothetical protein IH865_07920 [Chloroflexi bacterium]|nr:hypothetical protein [Chloroflexota bacterium]
MKRSIVVLAALAVSLLVMLSVAGVVRPSSIAPGGGTANAAGVPLIGMVADDATDSVIVFEAGGNTVLGAVPIGSGSAIGDCSITADQTLAFATKFNGRVRVIDLKTSPPSLATGINSIPISNNGEDTSISPDQQFLVVADGSLNQPISVINIATRTQISTLFLGHDTNSVEVLSDGSVLATSINTGRVRRLTIDGAGNLTDTGEVLSVGGPNNVFGAPSATSGIVITRFPDQIRSFTIPGLALVDTRNLSGSFGISGLVNPAGDRVYARVNSVIDVFSYNSATGALGAAPLFSIPISSTLTFFGMDQMAITPDGTKLYVSQPGALKVYNANTGAFITSITHPGIIRPTGVCFASGVAPQPQGELTVIKNVINDHGGTALPGDWTMDITGTNVSSTGFPGQSGSGVTVTLDAGAYSVAESGGPSGYAASFSADCSGTIATGESKTCTITNNDIAPQLTIIKNVVNDHGGTALPGAWTMDITGTDVSPNNFPGQSGGGVTVTLDAGAYSVAESGGPSGYAASFSAGCSGTIAIGGSKTCTITNDDIQPSLTIIKTVVNDHGGTATASDWTMDITGTNVSSTGFAGQEGPGVKVTLNAGAYSVDESGGNPNYTKNLSADCSGAIAVGESKTCTITNNDIAPQLTIIKNVINDHGGTAAGRLDDGRHWHRCLPEQLPRPVRRRRHRHPRRRRLQRR